MHLSGFLNVQGDLAHYEQEKAVILGVMRRVRGLLLFFGGRGCHRLLPDRRFHRRRRWLYQPGQP